MCTHHCCFVSPSAQELVTWLDPCCDDSRGVAPQVGGCDGVRRDRGRALAASGACLSGTLLGYTHAPGIKRTAAAPLGAFDYTFDELASYLRVLGAWRHTVMTHAFAAACAQDAAAVSLAAFRSLVEHDPGAAAALDADTNIR